MPTRLLLVAIFLASPLLGQSQPMPGEAKQGKLAAADELPEAPRIQVKRGVHWSLKAPKRRSLPVVAHRAWVANGIDHFVLARLEREGLEPSPEADRFTLGRRLSLDLVGLPPSPERLLAFARSDSPSAYEEFVDQLLGQPAYGERWAQLWLDLARYADSTGYASDPLRTIWPFRDWVIKAYNDNLPFDEFTRLQMAGDLIPGATASSKVATAFHRNTMTNTEGGTDDEEFRVAAVKDRVNTVAQTWLGMTMACAQCHDHKFDPISQEEYYRFFAFFNQSADADRHDDAPRLQTATPAERAAKQRHHVEWRLAEYQAQVAEIRSEDRLDRWLNTADWKSPRPPKKVARALADWAKGSQDPETRALILKWWMPVDPSRRLASQRAEGLRKRYQRSRLTSTPIMRELPFNKRRKSFIHEKGNFLVRGQEVRPGTPVALHPWEARYPSNRLGLAAWLTDPRNPLTARVAVNRLWAALFGKGLVETAEDFGSQGKRPTHPGLLDFLATSFVDSGWDQKALLKRIVMSRTYRQGTYQDQDSRRRDPRNRMLSRGPRFRLSAEAVRDQALAISGLLARKIGGPSVYPPQPKGLWQAAFNGVDRKWPTSRGDDRWRRSLYTFLRRTVPHPAMTVFDAPSREICTVRRSRTNTPLQALVTLNEPGFVAAAQGLARRVLNERHPSDEQRMKRMLFLCLLRPPEPDELSVLLQLLQDARGDVSAAPAQALRLATEPLGPLPQILRGNTFEVAAWTICANVVLNLDEVLTKP